MIIYQHELDPIHQLLTCLIVTNRHHEVKELVEKRITGENEHELRYYLGLAYACQEKVDEALNEIKKVLENKPDNKFARRLAFRLLIHQVWSKIEEKDYRGMAPVINNVVEIAANEPELHRELSKFKGILALSYLKAGNRDEAARIWEEELTQNPQNHQIVHNLAVLYYWWALDTEKNSEKEDETKKHSLWKKSIAYWVMLTNMDNFWQGWKREREELCSTKINDEDIKDLRKKLIDDRFDKVFHDYIDQYKLIAREEDAARHEDYLTTILLEKKVASYYKDVIDRVKKMGLMIEGTMKRWELIRALQEKEGNTSCFATMRGECKYNRDTCYWGEYCMADPLKWNKMVSPAISCGPLMFKEMDILPEVYKLIEIACNNNNVNENLLKLKILLSSLGKPLIMIDDQKKPRLAIDEWRKLPQEVKDSVEGKYVYSMALMNRGACILKEGKIIEALNDLSTAMESIVEAINFGKNSSLDVLLIPLRDTINKLVVDICEREAKILKQKGQIDKAIEMLIKGFKIVDTKSLRQHLASFYCDLGDKKLSCKDFPDARKDFEEALSFDPENRRAKEGIGTTFNNEGVAVVNDMDRAIELFRKALQHDPDSDVIKKNLSGALNGKGVKVLDRVRYSSSDRESILMEALRLFKEAHENDPCNDVIVKNHNMVLEALRKMNPWR